MPASMLGFLVNVSLSTGTFPDKLKITKIVPILPFFPKMIELIYDLLKFLNENNILINNQYGFREGHFTYMALLRLVNDITR